MSYKVVARYGSAAQGKKPIAYAVVDSDGIEVKRELYKETAERTAREMNQEAKKDKGRHFVSL